MQINQFVAGAALGDAITHFSEELKSIFEGFDFCSASNIYSDYKHTPPLYRQKYSSYLKYEGNTDNIAVYHFGIGSEVTEFFKKLPDKKILIYHNITPEKYFELISPSKVPVLKLGREQIKSLVNEVAQALGVSKYNAEELSQMGFKRTGVLPLIIEDEYFSKAPDPMIMKNYADNLVKLVTVGRAAPNKKLEDVLKMFYYYQKTVNPESRLFIVGSYGGMLNYYMYLRSLVERMNLKNVVFTGHVSQNELIAFYRLSHVFLTMSEHEGFCIPVLEAMYFGLPVFAYSASALPETLGGAGVLIREKNYPAIAEMIQSVIESPGLVNQLREKGRQRLEGFTKEAVREKALKIIQELIKK